MATNILPTGDSRVSLTDHGQLIASLSAILGFRPADSLIAVSLVGPTGKQVGPVIRIDLPPPEEEAHVLDTFTTLLKGHQVRSVALVVVGEHDSQRPRDAELPHTDLIELLHAGFGDLGPTIEHALWTPEIREGSIWVCYEDRDCRGVVPDDMSTSAAAAAAAAGCVTFGSREEMEQQLVPKDPEAVERVSELLAKAADELDPPADPDQLIARCAGEVRAALAQVKRSEMSTGTGLEFSDDQIVRLARALSHTRIRDACLAMALSPSESTRRQAERLWLELVRRVPEPERTVPAAMLAYAAYMRGEGALATIAIDTALAADPDNTLAGLLCQCLLRGLPPRKLRALGQVEDLVELTEPTDDDERGDACDTDERGDA